MQHVLFAVRTCRIGCAIQRANALRPSGVCSLAVQHTLPPDATATFSTKSPPVAPSSASRIDHRRTIPAPVYLQPRSRTQGAADPAPPSTSHPSPVHPPQSVVPPPRDIRVTFLGTASGRPTRTRNVSSTAVWIRNNDAASGTKETATRREKVLMFDCGDGTLLQSLHVPHLRNLMYLEVICLTHMHGDHAFGLPTVIASACNHSSDFAPKTPLHVFGPQGVSAYVKGALAQTKTWMDRPIVYHEVLKSNVKTHKLLPQPDVLYHQSADPTKQSMQIYEDADVTLHAGFLAHREMNCLGYVVTEKAHPSAVSSPRKLVLLGDTCDSGSLTSVAQSADLLVHEATFLDADVDKAQRTGHSTTGMAGSFARSISARHLCLTHFSQRYLTSELATGGVEDTALETHREQAQHAAGGETHVHLAQDFLTLHIMPRTESAASSSSLPMPQQREEKSSSEFSTTKTEHRSSAEASKATPTAASQPQPLHIAMPKKTRR